MKKIMQHQLKESIPAAGVFYLVLLILLIGTLITLTMTSHHVQNSGVSTASGIFTFVIGICLFSESFPLLIQYGNSRKQIYLGTVSAFMILNLMMSLLDMIVPIVTNSLFPGTTTHFSLALEFYERFFKTHTPVISVVTQLLFQFIFFFFSCTIGLFIAILFYRVSKVGKYLIAAELPCFFIILIPVLFALFPDFMEKVMDAVLKISGIASGNPYIGILSIFVGSVLFNIAGYFMIRRTQIV